MLDLTPYNRPQPVHPLAVILIIITEWYSNAECTTSTIYLHFTWSLQIH